MIFNWGIAFEKNYEWSLEEIMIVWKDDYICEEILFCFPSETVQFWTRL